tara:strand:+ start:817 stop:951 length:135 start_codon:yes stop_codon:yes gene_type:complete
MKTNKLLESQLQLIRTSTTVQLEKELKDLIKYKEAIEKELKIRK